MSTDPRAIQLQADAQTYIDGLSDTSGVVFDDATATLLRRVYLEGRRAGVEWAKELLGDA